MEIIQQHTITLDLPLTFSLGTNSRDYVLAEVKNLFEGKCYKNGYIIEVLQLLDESITMYIKHNTKQYVQTHVSFQCRTMQYIKGDIIGGCKIIKLSANEIIAETDYLIITILYDDINRRVLAENLRIIVELEECYYSREQNKATAIGKLYIPPKEYVIHELTSEEDYDYTNDIQTIKKLEDEYAELSKTFNSNNTFLLNTLSAFKTLKTIDENHLSIIDIVEGRQKLPPLSIVDLQLPITQMRIMKYDDTAANTYKGSSREIILIYIRKYAIYLKLMIDCLNTYNTVEQAKAHARIWALYKDKK